MLMYGSGMLLHVHPAFTRKQLLHCWCIRASTHLSTPSQGNPCCEEPDHRLHVVHRMPWLQILDWHRGECVFGGGVLHFLHQLCTCAGSPRVQRSVLASSIFRHCGSRRTAPLGAQ